MFDPVYNDNSGIVDQVQLAGNYDNTQIPAEAAKKFDWAKALEFAKKGIGVAEAIIASKKAQNKRNSDGISIMSYGGYQPEPEPTNPLKYVAYAFGAVVVIVLVVVVVKQAKK